MSRPRSRAVARAAQPALAVAITWAASRLLLVGVLLWVVTGNRPMRDALRGWDAAIYTRLAEHGYTKDTDVAFFPGLPLVLRGMHALGADTALAGALLSFLCSGLAAWALYRLGSRGWGFGPASQPATGAVAAGLWLLAPTTVFTSVAYTEAPFCAAAFWAWERARDKHFAQAGVLAALACSLRISGLFLVVALLVLALVGNGDDEVWRDDWSIRLKDAAWLLLPLAVLGAYAWWLHGRTGSWTAWFQAQQAGWGRKFTHPKDAFLHTWRAAQPERWPGRRLVAPVFFAEIVAMAVGLVTTLACLLRKRWAEATWVGVQLAAFGTSYWYMSVNRAVLLWFPLFLMLGAILGRPFQRRGRRGGELETLTLGVLGTLSVILAATWAWLYYSGQWAS